MATKTRQLADFLVAGGVSDAEIQSVPHIRPGILQPAVAGKLLDGTTSHSGAYGTAQSDGHSYYYTDIKGSKPIKDPRIGAHFGSQRHKFKSLQKLEQETATHGSDIYSVDGREWIRQVGYGFYNNSNGNFLNLGDTVNYYEITAYCSGINLINLARATATFRYTVDGGTEVATDYGANSLTSYPLGSRFVDAGNVSNLTSGLTLGIHTIKIRRSGTYGEVYGIELIAQDTTSTASKSKIQIPAQNVVSYGKKFAIPATAQHYDPFNGMSGAKTLTQLGDYIDTGTSLGMENWKGGTSNYYKPFNGGRVVKWVDSSGTIKTSVTMMPPNAQNAETTASNAFSDGEVQAGTNDHTITFNTSAIDHSLSEVAKTFHWREFGIGNANAGATGTYKDSSMLDTTERDVAFVMDDGLTSFAGNDGKQHSTNYNYQITGGSGTAYYTFIGTGFTSQAVGYNEIKPIAQNLPYGTHIIQLNRNGTVKVDGFELHASNSTISYGTHMEVTFHQPKMPPIPEDAVIVADFMLMADYVKSSSVLTDTSKGIRLVSTSRDCFHDVTSGTINTLVLNATRLPFGLDGINTSANDAGRCKLPAFGTQMEVQSHSNRGDIFVDGVDMAQTESGSGETGFMTQNVASTLGVHNFESRASSSNHNVSAIGIVTPIHTSSHYQPFETPFLKELVGGDRNMEQNNLVVTPDGKSWDSVTRDTSYLSNVSLSVMHGSNSWNSVQEFIVQRGWNSYNNMYSKEWTTAYNRWICLVDGDYQIGGGMLHRYSAGIALKLNNATIQELHAIANSSTGNIHSMNSFNMVIHAKRGDTLHIEGEKHGGAWSNIILSKLNG